MQNNKLLRYNSVSDHVTMVFVYAFTVFMVLVILIPLVFVVAASFSSPEALLSAKVFLWPVDFTLRGYKMIIKHHRCLRVSRGRFPLARLLPQRGFLREEGLGQGGPWLGGRAGRHARPVRQPGKVDPPRRGRGFQPRGL